MNQNSAIKKSGFILLSVALTGFLFVREASAISIGVDKPHINIISDPGTTDSGVIQVKNKGEVPISVRVTMADWTYDKEGERVFKKPGTTFLSCSDWIDIAPKEALVPANGALDFSYNITTPKDAMGGHYAVIFFNASGMEEEDKFKAMGIKLVGRIGTVVYQETRGKTNKIGSVPYFKIIKPKKNEPLLAEYKFKNEGNAFIRFKGTLSIMDKDGTLYGNAESKKDVGTLPGDVREDAIKWFGSLPKGDYDLILTVDMGEGTVPVIKQESISLERDI